MQLTVARLLLVSTAALGSSWATPQTLEPVTDPAAYEIYRTLLSIAWPNRSTNDPLLLQQETDIFAICRWSVQSADPEWKAVENNFTEENSHAAVLVPALRLDFPYRLIPKAEIMADDARLALKYPGLWQRRPESMEYAAVSRVGFNEVKTKAIVYSRRRSSGQVQLLEKRDGKWLTSSQRGGCVWIA